MTKVLPSSKTRIVEDIIDLPQETEVVSVLQKQKYCYTCQKVIPAQTDVALPGADVGLNTSLHLIYLWLSMCLPFTRISAYFNTIFGQRVSIRSMQNRNFSLSIENQILPFT
jgi:hypothetical protein